MFFNPEITMKYGKKNWKRKLGKKITEAERKQFDFHFGKLYNFHAK